MIMSQFCRIMMTAILVIDKQIFEVEKIVKRIVLPDITSQLRPTSIEKEVFPRMAQDDDLFAYNLSGRL